jgi:hypothetical protein
MNKLLPEDDAIRDELLDRLVDGELCEGEYRRTLQRLDASPDSWRRCALSFLEQQALQRDLRQLLRESSDSPRVEIAPKGGKEVDDRGGFADGQRVPSVASHDWDGWFRQPWVRWSSVVAVGLLAFVSGFALRFGSNPGPDPGRSGLSTGRRDDFAAVSAPSSTSDLTDDDRQLLRLTVPGEEPLELPVEMVRYTDGGPRVAPERLPAPVERIISESKAPNRMERRLMMLRTPSDRFFIVPVDRIIVGDDYQ